MIYGAWPAPTVVVPWVGSKHFQEIATRMGGMSVVTHDRWWILYSLLRHRHSVRGDVAECGVFRGGTAYLLASAMDRCGKKLYLFDTFSGLPPGTPGIDNRYVDGGEFADTSKELVTEYVLTSGIPAENLDVRAGLIPGTFQGLEKSPFSFVHLDLDIYRSIMDGLSFFWPRMSAGGVIVVDDYGFPECQGAYAACEDFGREVFAPPVQLGTGQAIFIKG